MNHYEIIIFFLIRINKASYIGGFQGDIEIEKTFDHDE